MRFYVHKRKQTPSVIIVALVDVLIVLLIFLIVTTTFKQQPALKITLPESSEAQKTGSSENPPLIVSVDDKGIVRLGNDPKPIPLDALKPILLSELKKKPDLKVAISGDTTSQLGIAVKIMDAIRGSGVKQMVLNVKEAGKP